MKHKFMIAETFSYQQVIVHKIHSVLKLSVRAQSSFQQTKYWIFHILPRKL